MEEETEGMEIEELADSVTLRRLKFGNFHVRFKEDSLNRFEDLLSSKACKPFQEYKEFLIDGWLFRKIKIVNKLKLFKTAEFDEAYIVFKKHLFKAYLEEKKDE